MKVKAEKIVKEETVAKAANKGNKRVRKTWTDRFVECKAYREKFSHCKIPTGYKENKSLGVWVQEQRRNFKLLKQGKTPRASLTQEHIEMLDEIGFDWGWTPDPNQSAETEASWEANFKKLQEYKESHGNFDVCAETGSSKLAKWTRVQRNQFNLRATKRKCFITKERIEKLGEFGFDWDGPRKIE